MIIKGNPAGNVGFWASHLLRDDTNERVEVVEMRGLLAEDLPTGLREMEAIAAGSRSHGNFMYQANISPRIGEHLTPEQWAEAVDTLEKNLGLQGHQRIVIEHEKRGEDGELRAHRHIVWNRVDVDDLRVADMGGNWRTHERTARELEARFDLTPSPDNNRGSLDRKPAVGLWEIRAAERSGIAPADVKAELTELWRATDSGKAFAAALEDRGYILAQGDRRDFCVVDQAGDVHSLARRLDGVRAAGVRERLADLDRESLPTVAEARGEQRTRAQPAPELGRVAGEIRLLWNLSKSGEGFAAALDERGMTLARVDAGEAGASQRAHAFAKELGNYAPSYEEGEIVVVNSFGSVNKLNERTTGQSADQIQKQLGTLDHDALLSVTDARVVMREASRIEFFEKRQEARPISPMEARILTLQQEAVTGGAFAAALYREGITIARADAAGIEGLARDKREAFQSERLSFVPTLKEGELVAVNRYGGVHTLNPTKIDLAGLEIVLTGGNRTIPDLGYAREEIAGDRVFEEKMRSDRDTAFWQGVQQRREGKETADQTQWGVTRDAEVARVTNAYSPKTEPTLSVTDGVTGLAVSLTDFVSNLFDGNSRQRSPAEIDAIDQIRAQQRALEAVESIRDSMERGETLRAEDLQHLTPTHLENIRLRGDDYIRELVERAERSRDRWSDYERERER